jgi:4-amino-4-deoxy-L-arabinose transferase-like glycosyltransferase
MATSAMTRHASSAQVWGAVVAALVVLAHLPSFFHRLLDGDEAIYGAIAALMNAGGKLYADGGVDNKPPGIFWVYAATFHLFGTYQMTAIHAVSLAAVAATCAILLLIARSMGSVRAGLLAALAYGVFTGAGYPRLGAANTEVFMMLPLAASVLLQLERRWLWSGAMLALAGVFKQVAAANLLLFPVALVLLEPAERRLRAGIAFGVGLAGAGLLVLLAVAITGSLPGMLHWTVATLFGYASASWRLDGLWQRIVGGPQGGPLQFVETTAILWLATGWYVSRWKSLGARERLMVAWLAAGVAGALAGGHMFGHYFIQALGPLAVLAGLAIDSALKTPMRRWVAAAVTVGIAVPMVGWVAYDFNADPITYDWGQPVAQHELVATYIRNHTQPSDRVFVWGDWPALYVESDRQMASRFPGFLRGFARGSGLPPNNWDTTPEVWTELQSDLAKTQPILIVDTSTAQWSDFSMYPMRNYPMLADFVTSRYHVVATIDGVVVYAPNG